MTIYLARVAIVRPFKAKATGGIGSISAVFSSPVFDPSGEERGDISRTAAGYRTYGRKSCT